MPAKLRILSMKKPLPAPFYPVIVTNVISVPEYLSKN